MIYDHFRSTGASEAVQGSSDSFNVRLQNHDVQDFDVRWDQALLLSNDIPSDMILEGLYKSKFQESVSFRLFWHLYDQETILNNGQPSSSCVWQQMRGQDSIASPLSDIWRQMRDNNSVACVEGSMLWVK